MAQGNSTISQGRWQSCDHFPTRSLRVFRSQLVRQLSPCQVLGFNTKHVSLAAIPTAGAHGPAGPVPSDSDVAEG